MGYQETWMEYLPSPEPRSINFLQVPLWGSTISNIAMTRWFDVGRKGAPRNFEIFGRANGTMSRFSPPKKKADPYRNILVPSFKQTHSIKLHIDITYSIGYLSRAEERTAAYPNMLPFHLRHEADICCWHDLRSTEPDCSFGHDNIGSYINERASASTAAECAEHNEWW